MGEAPSVSPQVQDLRAILHQALRTVSPLERYKPSPTRRTVDGDVALFAGADFRHVQVLGPAVPKHVFALAAAFFGDADGYSVEVEVETAGAVENALIRREWVLTDEEPALVLSEIPNPPVAPAGLSIRLVTDAAGLDDFHALSPQSARWVPSVAAATAPAVALFVGYVAGVPAAGARMACLGPTVEITSVTTAAEFRRRGYGTALTWAAIGEGGRRGCTAAMLTATAIGYPLYLRMGFRRVCTFRSYVQPTVPMETVGQASSGEG
ncbi:MAG: GNAT family N-acetyltransferase [Chloroflexota bacterium]